MVYVMTLRLAKMPNIEESLQVIVLLINGKSLDSKDSKAKAPICRKSQ